MISIKSVEEYILLLSSHGTCLVIPINFFFLFEKYVYVYKNLVKDCIFMHGSDENIEDQLRTLSRLFITGIYSVFLRCKYREH